MNLFNMLIMASVALQPSSGQSLPCPQICNCYINNKGMFTVDCSNKLLTELPQGIDHQTQILDLSKNFFDSIPAELRSFPNLEELDMNGNKIMKLESHSLYNMTALHFLDLSNNLITAWKDLTPSKVLKPAERLTHLILSRNNLTIFSTTKSSEILQSATLEVLELENCGIGTVYGKSPIAGLTNIKKLILKQNPLRRFYNLVSPTLQYLDLSYCELSYLYGNEFDYLASLTHLSISNNYRLVLSPNLSSSTLGYLDISFCNMDGVAIPGLYNLREANFRGNMLRKLRSGSFMNNSLLLTLDLSSNAIESIEVDAFEGLTSLKMLNLSVNVIPHIHDDTFSGTPSLTFLYLSRNYLSSVGNLKSEGLSYLDMSTCEIQTVPTGAFENMPKLLKINLSKNMIGFLPDNVKSDSLQVFDLSFNRLRDVNNLTFASLPALTTLLVSENRFTEVWKVSYFENNHQLLELSLNDNTWQCDCSGEMLKFFQFITNDPPKVWHIADLKCHIPSELNGKNWLDACYFVWNPGSMAQERERVLMFLLTIAVCFFGCFCAVWLIRQSMKRKLEVAQREREREIETTRDRMREERMRREQEEERNAPDPRDLISPPSYDEALLMPRLDGSYYSLAGVGIDEPRKKRRQNRRSRSSGDLLEDVKKSERRKRSRTRRETDQTGQDGRGENNNNNTRNRENGEIQNAQSETNVQVVIHMHESDL